LGLKAEGRLSEGALALSFMICVPKWQWGRSFEEPQGPAILSYPPVGLPLIRKSSQSSGL